jgi:predicted ArsR family transcriptional regulator
MGRFGFDERFFESTRGKIVKLLWHSERTVNDLAAELSLTDNAVRAHLLSLERDGIVESGGTVKGFRKPHFTFKLSDKGRRLFPRSYDSLLIRFLDALKSRLSPSTISEVLRDTGMRLAANGHRNGEVDFDQKVENALSSLKELGGAAALVEQDDQTFLKSDDCPFAEAVKEHPEICKVTESFLSESLGRAVSEQCDRASEPKCRFLIEPIKP